MRPPLLVVGVGNPSRGDDAIGPTALERLEVALADEIARGEVELLGDFQLQIEHALDLEGRLRVFTVDASVAAAAPFVAERVKPARDRSYTSHALSPSALLDVAARTLGDPPETWCVAVPGARFELGEPLSDGARANVEAAVTRLVARVRDAQR